MSSYTPQQIRDYIDDLDAVLRGAVIRDELKEVFARERSRIDVLMNVSKECRGQKDIMAEIAERRFLWRLLKGWHASKGDTTKVLQFWKGQKEILEDFDVQFPNRHRPAFPLGERPKLSSSKASSPPLPAPAPAAATSRASPTIRLPAPAPAPAAALSSRAPVVNLPAPHISGVPAPNLPAPTNSRAPVRTPAPAQSTSQAPVSILPAPVSTTHPAPAPAQSTTRPPARAPVQIIPAPAPAPVQPPLPRMIKANVPAPPSPPRKIAPLPPKQTTQPPRPLPLPKKISPAVPPPKTTRPPSPRYINRFAPLTTEEPVEEGSDDEYQPPASPAPVNKGKGKMVSAIKVQHASNPTEKKRAKPEKSEVRRKIPCVRCFKSRKDCYEQVGIGAACYGCAYVKMKCEENEGDSPQKRPSPEPFSRSTSPEAAPGPSKPAPAPPKQLPASQGDSPAPHPTPAPRKKPAAKRKTAPAPAPATSEGKPAKRRKMVKTQEHIESGEDDDDNLSERSRLPIMRRVGEFETYCDVRLTRMDNKYNMIHAMTGTMADSMDRYNTNEDAIMDAVNEVPDMKKEIDYLKEALELTAKQVEGLKVVVIKQNRAIEMLILRTDSLDSRKRSRTPSIIDVDAESLPPSEANIRVVPEDVVMPDVPVMPEVVATPDDEETPVVPVVPEVVATPEGPETPVVPAGFVVTPEVPDGMSTPVLPDADVIATPEVLAMPEVPEVDGGFVTTPEVPDGMSTPVLPDGVATPEVPNSIATAEVPDDESTAVVLEGPVTEVETSHSQAVPEEDVEQLTEEVLDSAPAFTGTPLSVAPTATAMPPPAPPFSSQIPDVHLQPPTPNTSQDATSPTTLLKVPDSNPSDNSPPTKRTTSRSRSPTPSQPRRRSPRLSPAPGNKRPASDPLDEPANKKHKE